MRVCDLLICFCFWGRLCFRCHCGERDPIDRGHNFEQAPGLATAILQPMQRSPTLYAHTQRDVLHRGHPAQPTEGGATVFFSYRTKNCDEEQLKQVRQWCYENSSMIINDDIYLYI
jgi:hypothetical protein